MENYAWLGSVADLLYGVEVARIAIRESRDDDPKLARRLGILSAGLLFKFSRYELPDDLDEAMLVLENAVQIPGMGIVDQAYAVNQQARVLEFYCGYFGHDTIDQATFDLKKCFLITDGAFDYSLSYASHLGWRVNFQGTIEDLDQSIQILGEAYKTLPRNSFDRAIFFTELGKGYMRRYKLEGDIADLQRAIEELRKAADHWQVTGSTAYLTLNDLFNCLNDLFEANDDQRALIESIQIMEKVVESLDDDHPQYGYFLRKLNNHRQKHGFVETDARQSVGESTTIV